MASGILHFILLAVVGQSDPVLLYFTANGCAPCAQMRPSLEQLHREGWNVQAADATQRQDLVRKFEIQNLPTLVILSGGREVDRMVGVTTYEQIRKRADRVAARVGPASGASSSAQSNPSLVQQASAQVPSARASVPQQSGPIVRGQSPVGAASTRFANQAIEAAQGISNGFDLATRASQQAAPPELSPEQAIARAAAATVRIRVDEGNTTAHGTGTIVDVHGNEALVLTCGHLFRDMQAGSQVSVDLFAGTPNEINVPSELIDFQAEESDIGLISFRLPVQIEPVPLLRRGGPLQIGQPAFSFGCDHGNNPTRRDTRITNINRYVGPDNIEIAGAPAVGRSGGGLFDMQGRLIGVCNAADANDNEGIYASADVVYSQIERVGLSHLFEMSTASQLAAQAPVASNAERAVQPASFEMEVASSPAPIELRGNGGAKQLICIVRDADGRDQVVTIDSPSPDLLQRIQHDAGALSTAP